MFTEDNVHIKCGGFGAVYCGISNMPCFGISSKAEIFMFENSTYLNGHFWYVVLLNVLDVNVLGEDLLDCLLQNFHVFGTEISYVVVLFQCLDC